jgi:hypothetical protein
MRAESDETPLTCAANEGGGMKRNEGATLADAAAVRFVCHSERSEESLSFELGGGDARGKNR